MKKGLIVILVIICVIIVFPKCQTSPKFLDSQTNIENIYIVEIGEDTTTDNSIMIQSANIITKIDDQKTFMQELLKLKCYNRMDCNVRGTPQGTTAIQIRYTNNRFEYIACSGRATFDGTHYKRYAGHYYFDQEEFDTLINSYISQEE